MERRRNAIVVHLAAPVAHAPLGGATRPRELAPTPTDYALDTRLATSTSTFGAGSARVVGGGGVGLSALVGTQTNPRPT